MIHCFCVWNHGRGGWLSPIRRELWELCQFTILLGLLGRFPSALTSAAVPNSSSTRPGRGRSRWHSCSGLLFGGISPTSSCSFYLLLRSTLPSVAQPKRRGHLAWSWVFSFSIPIRRCWFQYPQFPEYSKKYFLKGGSLLRVAFPQG